MSLTVIKTATLENWSEEKYLLANQDVADYVRAGGNARRHFEDHGLQEGRKTISPEFLGERAERSRQCYERFAYALNEQHCHATVRPTLQLSLSLSRA